jgi:anthraniloyl-CoA monooxygenase
VSKVRIVCVGGGPAGLYLSILMRLASRGSEVTVIERNPAGVTYGWGVVFWDTLLDDLQRNDPVSASAIRRSAASWSGQEVRVNGRHTAHLGGSGFSIGRRRLLDILIGRALDLGVDVRFEREVESAAEFPDADLVVAGDGAGSRLRQRHPEHFGTGVEVGRNKYVWLGTRRVFDVFTFAFERTDAGWIWFHGYRFDGETSTCIVECSPETWEGLGLDRLGPDESVRLLERIFAAHLEGHSLIDQSRDRDRTPWLSFRRVTNETWWRDNVVLLGDAAHTTHFAIGLGTELAIMDAIGLARQLRRRTGLEAALRAYEADRRRALLHPQEQARSSSEWFEDVPRHIEEDPLRFAYSLWTRRGSYPLWRYQVHLAMQLAPVRGLWQGFTRARRSVRARRRASLAPAESPG